MQKIDTLQGVTKIMKTQPNPYWKMSECHLRNLRDHRGWNERVEMERQKRKKRKTGLCPESKRIMDEISVKSGKLMRELAEL